MACCLASRLHCGRGSSPAGHRSRRGSAAWSSSASSSAVGRGVEPGVGVPQLGGRRKRRRFGADGIPLQHHHGREQQPLVPQAGPPGMCGVVLAHGWTILRSGRDEVRQRQGQHTHFPQLESLRQHDVRAGGLAPLEQITGSLHVLPQAPPSAPRSPGPAPWPLPEFPRTASAAWPRPAPGATALASLFNSCSRLRSCNSLSR